MPKITRQDREAAEKIWGGDYPFDKNKFVKRIAAIIARRTRDGELREALRELVDRIAGEGSFVRSAIERGGQAGMIEPCVAEARALLATLDAKEGGKDA